jgi:hypothetical protein
VEEIVRLGNVIRVELRDEIIPLVAVMVVEEGEITLLAARAARPGLAVIIHAALARRDMHAVGPAPGERFGRRILVGEPGVVRHGLSQHGAQGRGHDLERLRRRLRDHHGDPAAGGNPQRTDGTPRIKEDGDEVNGQKRYPSQKRRHQERAGELAVANAGQPPLPEIDDARGPERDADEIFHALAAREYRCHERLVPLSSRGDRSGPHCRTSRPKNGAAERTMVSRSE